MAGAHAGVRCVCVRAEGRRGGRCSGAAVVAGEVVVCEQAGV